ncbi:MAG: metal ABC transporter permease [Spirochaetes bacterium]|nr:metal ABC transporter permease [Spirochaetota bacterium]
MLELLTYKPVIYGLILLVSAGFTFPLSGVFIIRMNLLPIRFLLMHGVLLGGALGLVTGINPSLLSLTVNILLILILNRVSKYLKMDYGQLTMFFMIAAIAGASILISLYNVPAKDTLSLLWGSLYVADLFSIISALILGGLIVLFSWYFFRHMTAVFFDRDVAVSMNIRAGMFEFAIMIIVALVVSASMRLMGALLLDALILLPVVISGLFVTGLRQMMLISCLLGGLFAISGFFISILFDIPVSAGIAIPAVFMFSVMIFLKKGVINGIKK